MARLGAQHNYYETARVLLSTMNTPLHYKLTCLVLESMSLT